MDKTEIIPSYTGTCYCGKPVVVGWIDKDSDGDYWRHTDRSHITEECASPALVAAMVGLR